VKRIFIAGSARVFMPNVGMGKASKLLSILSLNDIQLTVDVGGDFFLSIDHNKSAYESFIRAGGLPERAFLLRLEPPSVFPSQYKKSIEKKYGYIYSPGSTLQNPSNFFGWPYQKLANPNIPTLSSRRVDDALCFKVVTYSSWLSRTITLSMVAANKVSPSFGQNYSLRRKFAHNLTTLDFQLFGPLWSCSFMKKVRHRLAVGYFAIRQGTVPGLLSIWGNIFFRYPRSLGAVSDKHLVLENSKFSLVIENSNTYVSEKLFDSIVNHCIPVYFGPKLSTMGIPEDLAIYYDGPEKGLVNFLKGFTEVEIQHKLDVISEFLHSREFKFNWSETAVYTRISKDIIDRMDKARSC